MSTDARSLPSDTVIATDVCVVGAGPAGITTALTLAKAGIRVLLLEGGDRSLTPESRSLARGYSVGESYFPLHTTRGFGFGGTSSLWFPGYFRTAPLTSLDFETREGIPHSGWPISRSELETYYAQAVSWCGLGKHDFTPDGWVSDDAAPLPFSDGAVETVVFQSAPSDTWTRRYDQVRRASNLSLVLNAPVVELSSSSDGARIDRVRVRTTAGNAFEVRPRSVVLAAGGIENARLLLLSRARQPGGIGNEYDLVGRYFQEHLALRGGILRLADPDQGRRMGLYFMHPTPDGTRVQAKISLGSTLIQERRLLGCAFFVTRVSEARASEVARSLAALKRAAIWTPPPSGIPDHLLFLLRSAPALPRLMAARSREVLQLLSEAEQAPNPASRVTLREDRLDSLGRPRVQVEWRTTELDRRSIAESQAVLDQALRRSGIGRLENPITLERPRTGFAGHWHHMGTTRMHDSPKFGVVDRNARVHGIGNLFITGSSVFPTSGYANPTLTIVALALRLADHIRELLPSLPA